MDVIDCLPPGLYEMVLSPRPANLCPGGFVTGDWIARFEARSLDDIRALGRNSPEDDRAFAALDHLVEQTFFAFYGSPFVQALFGLNDHSEVRPFPGTSPEKLAARQVQADAYAAKLLTRRIR